MQSLQLVGQTSNGRAPDCLYGPVPQHCLNTRAACLLTGREQAAHGSADAERSSLHTRSTTSRRKNRASPKSSRVGNGKAQQTRQQQPQQRGQQTLQQQPQRAQQIKQQQPQQQRVQQTKQQQPQQQQAQRSRQAQQQQQPQRTQQQAV